MDLFFAISGLGLGLVSSLHCIGMCGPLALSLPFAGMERKQRMHRILLYNTGRVCTYALLGLFPGWIGSLFFAAGYQRWFSIGVGLFVLLYFIIAAWKKRTAGWYGIVQRWILRFLAQPSSFHFFLVGMANGLLPCGMVYMAISYAALAGSAVESSLFMLCYGLGTLPLMATLSLGWMRIPVAVRSRLRTLIPYAGIVIGGLLVLRGMGLGIPFVSPVNAGHNSHIAIDCN